MFSQTLETTIGLQHNHQLRFMFLGRTEFSPSLRELYDKSGPIWRSASYPDAGFDMTEGLNFPDGDVKHSIEAHWELLPFMLAAVAVFPNGTQALDYVKRVKFQGLRDSPTQDAVLLNATTRLVSSPVVPVRQNPILTKSLEEIIKSGSGTQIGATVGFLVGWGTPYLIVTVPIGILLCSGAIGLAKAWEKGAEKVVGRWLGWDGKSE